MVKVKEIVIFGIIGVLNTSIDIGVFAILKNIFNIDNQSNWLNLINFSSMSVAIIFSYIANKYFTFQHTKKTNHQEIAGFLIVNLFSFIVNTIILRITIFLLPDIIPIPIFTILQDPAIIGKILGTAGSMFVSFIGYKFFVFKK